jgi:GNAT superfamily N-acetyltransferase
MTRDVLLRRATQADIPAMSRIRLSVTENVLRDPGRINVAMYEDFLERSGRGWVAEADGAIVGFSYADNANASIWALFIQPGQEGRGLGKALLDQATAWLFEQGHERIRLTTGAGTRADRFYAAQGWQREPVSATEIAYTLARPVVSLAP